MGGNQASMGGKLQLGGVEPFMRPALRRASIAGPSTYALVSAGSDASLQGASTASTASNAAADGGVTLAASTSGAGKGLSAQGKMLTGTGAASLLSTSVLVGGGAPVIRPVSLNHDMHI